MNRDIIAFVRGVDKHGASPPDGFPCRLALLTWFQNQGDAVDPWPLMRLAVPRIAALVDSDSVMAEYWEHHRKGIFFPKVEKRMARKVSWDRLVEKSDEALLEEEFPSRFSFLRGNRVVIKAESELWNLVGGPSPYHDSVTVSFFTTAPIDEPLYAIFVEEAGKLGISIGQAKEVELEDGF